MTPVVAVSIDRSESERFFVRERLPNRRTPLFTLAKLTWLVMSAKPVARRPTRHTSSGRAGRGRSMSNKPRFGLKRSFATYVSVPIFMTVVFAANPENLETIIKQHAYVVYPRGPEAADGEGNAQDRRGEQEEETDSQKEPSNGWFARLEVRRLLGGDPSSVVAPVVREALERSL